MNQDPLQNLVRILSLKSEPPDQGEFDGLVRAAERKLRDAENMTVSADSRFILAYDASHSLALAALRRRGFRPDRQRYIVFETLVHTVSFPAAKWRLLYDCHAKRNLALYEGGTFDDEQLIKELIAVTRELLATVKALGPVAM